MSDFDPGPGWRSLEFIGDQELPHDTIAYLKPKGGWVYWVREEPVPPLPTEPYTVIRVTWRDATTRSLIGDVLTLYGDDSHWRDGDDAIAPNAVAERITGFEVLAESRAVTAKAVLQPLFDALEGDGKVPGRFLSELAQQFGVSDV